MSNSSSRFPVRCLPNPDHDGDQPQDHEEDSGSQTDDCPVQRRTRVDLDVAHRALDLYEVDQSGLDRLDRAVLDVLCRRFGGGPVGVSTLAVGVGEERETVEEVAEPFLVRCGFLARTPRGRVATPAAWAHLGLVPPRGAPFATGDAGQSLFDPEE